jgi:uncharacterized protein
LVHCRASEISSGCWLPSALDAAGLTAAISTALADAGLSCNVIAGYHHDHLLVPADRAPEALAVLSDVSRGTRP